MLRHIAVENSPPIMRNREEAIKHAEGERRYCEEVHRGDGFPMITQKGRLAGSGSLGAFIIQRSTVRSEMSKAKHL